MRCCASLTLPLVISLKGVSKENMARATYLPTAFPFLVDSMAYRVGETQFRAAELVGSMFLEPHHLLAVRLLFWESPRASHHRWTCYFHWS